MCSDLTKLPDVMCSGLTKLPDVSLVALWTNWTRKIINKDQTNNDQLIIAVIEQKTIIIFLFVFTEESKP